MSLSTYHLPELKLKFDFIFADPPYSYPKIELETLVDLIFKKEVLKKNGILTIEHHKNSIINDNKYLFDTRRYGTNSLSIFK